MKKTIIFLVAIVFIAAIWWYHSSRTTKIGPAQYVLNDVPATSNSLDAASSSPVVDIPLISTVATQLEIPWEVVFLPDGEMLVTERPGTLVLLKGGSELPVPGIRHIGEGGLLGAALHPDFSENRLLYLYQTTQAPEGLINRIVRYRLDEAALTLDQVILDNIPGARFHDGGRIAFGPDGHLYATVGDATNEDEAQNPQSLNGTILRLTAEGEIPADNPFDSYVYSYGHRNPQGLAWDEAGNLWSTEHGRSGIRSGFDELNLIQAGGNYGWPDSQGDVVAAGTIGPVLHSGAETTWAPASAAFLNGSLFFAGLRGEALYEAVLDGKEVIELRQHVTNYGRLRTVAVGPDRLLYLTTSNRDGRGDHVAPEDDRLLRVNPLKLLQ